MVETFTETAESNAALLSGWQVGNYNLAELTFTSFNIGTSLGVNSLDEGSSRVTMFASERVLSRDWNSPEEDEAWADL